MIKQFPRIFLVFIVLSAKCMGQDTDTGPGFQMIMMNNPAFTGGEGNAALRLSYMNYYPGSNYNLHSVYISYDNYFPSLHGGAGFYVTDDYLGGIVNDLRGGLSYSYFLQAGRDIFINAGLSASVYHRGYSFEKAVFPDQIDPLEGASLPTSELLASTGRTIFDIGAGFLFISGKFFCGISVSHLAEPDLSGTGSSSDRLKRRLMLHLSRDIILNSKTNLKIRPQLYTSVQSGFFSAGAGASAEINFFSVNAILLGDNGNNMNLQTGFSLKSAKACFYYNYRFNIVSGNSLMPMSLLHQAGLLFSLNSVDKRNLVKTINFPKL